MTISGLSAITFDCYGTLVDWEMGISAYLTRLLKEKRVLVDVSEILRAREDIEFEMIQATYKPYREILALSLKEAFYRLSIPYGDQDGEQLAESVPDWPPFAETKTALEKLCESASLAIISNIDNDIIKKTRERLGVKFQVVVTAQDAKAYKPNTAPFDLALRRLNCKPKDTLHVSSGFKYDIPPARKLGFRTAWINRKQEKAKGQVDYEFPSLTELANNVS